MESIQEQLEKKLSLIKKANGSVTFSENDSDEVKLSKATFICESMGLKESTRKIERKNGTGTLSEAEKTATRVKQTMRDFGFSEKEAYVYLGLEFIPEALRDKPELADRMRTLRELGFNESDSVKILENGWFFQS